MIMAFPIPSRWKLKLNLKENLPLIEYAIHIKDESRYSFRREIETLYPRLEKYGMTMPKIPNLDEGSFYMDDTLYNFHLSTLQELSRRVRHGSFDLESWNEEVVEQERRRERSM